MKVTSFEIKVEALPNKAKDLIPKNPYISKFTENKFVGKMAAQKSMAELRKEAKKSEVEALVASGLAFKTSVDDVLNARNSGETADIFSWIQTEASSPMGVLTGKADLGEELLACVQFLDKYVIVQAACKTSENTVKVGNVSVQMGTDSLEVGKWTPRRLDTYCRLRLADSMSRYTESEEIRKHIASYARASILPLSATYGFPSTEEIIKAPNFIRMYMLSLSVCAAPALLIRHSQFRPYVIAILCYQVKYAAEIGLKDKAKGTVMTKEDIFSNVFRESTGLTDDDFNNATTYAALMSKMKPKQKKGVAILAKHSANLNKVMAAFGGPSASNAKPGKGILN